MSYIVSARKYRPQTFEDVVGQEQITATLKRSIETDHLAQAFLFCGPRGVGKTTCARIMAKAVNTGKTEKLHEIDEDFSFNIFELDAASNNKVDDMHQLIAQVRIPPQNGKYKIYIIDEVHMLSQAAFNAFLKTLEEPPPYAIFILATTEKHKILPTILSRCQIYDFRRISVNDIVKHLEKIAEEEHIEADESALHIVAEKADGALRDALSIFDRLVSFAGNKLTYEAAVSSLNVLDYDYFFKVSNFLLTSDLPNTLLVLDEILNNGFEGDHFMNGLSNHFRNLMVCKDVKTVKLLEVSDALKKRYYEQAQIAPLSFLVSALSLASNCDVNYAMSINKRLLVETSLMKMAYLQQVLNMEHTMVPEKKNSNKLLKQETTSVTVGSKPMEVKDTAIKVEIPKEERKPITLSLDLNSLEQEIEAELSKSNVVEPTESALEENIEIGSLDFTSENVQKIWLALLADLRSSERMKILHVLEDSSPEIDGSLIKIKLDSEVEKSLVEKDIVYLSSFFKKQLNHKDLALDFWVDATQPAKKIILSPMDVANNMMEKNPALKNLRERLDLDIEY